MKKIDMFWLIREWVKYKPAFEVVFYAENIE
jgi:hypothetical protein